MALIPIITIPDPVLRKVAAPVTEITDGVRQLLTDDKPRPCTTRPELVLLPHKSTSASD